jgi:hypothetical protein
MEAVPVTVMVMISPVETMEPLSGSAVIVAIF